MPLQVPSNLLYFRSGTSTGGGCIGLTMEPSSTNVFLTPWQGGKLTELWTVEGDPCTIATAYANADGDIYLSSADAAGAQVFLYSEPSYWRVTNNRILNSSGTLALGFDDSSPPNCILVSLENEDAPSQHFVRFPIALRTPSAPGCGTIQSGLTPGGPFSDPMGLNIDGNKPFVGSDIVLWPLADGGRNQLWKRTADGRLQSALNLGLVLDAGVNPSQGAQLTVSNWSMSEGSNQRWTLEKGVLTSRDTSDGPLVVDIAGGIATAGAGIVLASPKEGSGSQVFHFNHPRNIVEDILAGAPVPFHEFSGMAHSAYMYINRALGLGPDQTPPIPLLREQYTNYNLATVLPAWSAAIDRMDRNGCSPPVTEEVWKQVTKTLRLELEMVPVVQAMFANFLNAMQQTVELNEATCNEIIGLLSLPDVQSPNPCSGWIGPLIEGLLYTLLNVFADGVPILGVVANLMSMGFSIAMGCQSGGTPPDDSLQLSYDQLWANVAQNFLAVVGSTGQAAKLVLSDWGKLQAAYKKALIPGANGLAWPAGLDGQLLEQSSASFTNFALQSLVPAAFQILKNENWSGQPPANSWQDPEGNVYFLASNTNSNSFPSNEFLTYLFENVEPIDVFQNLNGWALPVSNRGAFGLGYATTVTISNQAQRPLKLHIVPSAEAAHRHAVLAPGQCDHWQTFCNQQEGYPWPSTVSLYDESISHEAPVVSFQVTQDDGVPTVSNIAVTSGYVMPQPICNPGDNEYDTGAVRAIVYGPA